MHDEFAANVRWLSHKLIFPHTLICIIRVMISFLGRWADGKIQSLGRFSINKFSQIIGEISSYSDDS